MANIVSRFSRTTKWISHIPAWRNAHFENYLFIWWKYPWWFIKKITKDEKTVNENKINIQKDNDEITVNKVLNFKKNTDKEEDSKSKRHIKKIDSYRQFVKCFL